MNVFAGEKEDRIMITGLHTVADIFCVRCGSIVGWKYVRLEGSDLKRIRCFSMFLVATIYLDDFFQETAHEKSQRYKEGKSVLERLVENYSRRKF